MTNKRKKSRLDDDTVFWGIIWGLCIGAVVAIVNLPKAIVDKRLELLSSAKDIHHQVDLSEPIADSIASGKELAKRNRENMPDLTS